MLNQNRVARNNEKNSHQQSPPKLALKRLLKPPGQQSVMQQYRQKPEKKKMQTQRHFSMDILFPGLDPHAMNVLTCACVYLQLSQHVLCFDFSLWDSLNDSWKQGGNRTRGNPQIFLDTWKVFLLSSEHSSTVRVVLIEDETFFVAQFLLYSQLVPCANPIMGDRTKWTRCALGSVPDKTLATVGTENQTPRDRKLK